MKLKYFESDRHPTWLELFYDLIYAAAIAKTTHLLSENIAYYTHKGYLLRYFLTFIPIWWCWIGHTLVLNRFDVDDYIQKMMTYIKMLMIIVLVSVIGDTSDKAYAIFIFTYATIRVMIVLGYFRARNNFPEYRAVAEKMGKRFMVGIFLSLLSLAFSGMIRYSIFYSGIALDIFFTLINSKFLGKYPVHGEHLIERLGLFTLILLGDGMAGIALSLSDSSHTFKWLAGILGFIMLCSIWWIYSGSTLKILSKKHIKSGLPSVYGHLSIYLSLGMIASVIKASVARNMIWANYSVVTMIGFYLFFIGKQFLRTIYPKGVKKAILIIISGTAIMFVPLMWLLENTREYLTVITVLTIILVGAAIFISYTEQRPISD